jgi:hypothetical protein
MRKSKLLIALFGALALVACHSHDDSAELVPAGFTATIAQQTATRAYDSSWEAGDAIGISGKSGDVNYSNVAYTTATGNGTFTPVNAAESILYMNSDSVNFTAYYPWQEGATSTIEFSTADQSNQKAFDFLFGTGRGSSAAPKVNIAFRHTMAKVIFTLKAGDDITFEQLKAAAMQLTGITVQGTFDVTTGETRVNSLRDSDIISIGEGSPRAEHSDSSSVEYAIIVFPQQLGQSVTLTFTVNGLTLTATLTLPDNNTLQEGTQYEVAITLNKTYATVDGCTISPWNKRLLDEITAE